MKLLTERYTRHELPHEHHHSRLLEEVAYLEARLVAIGQNGDCAYEKAMARYYRERLRHRRQELFAGRQGVHADNIEIFMALTARFLQLSD